MQVCDTCEQECAECVCNPRRAGEHASSGHLQASLSVSLGAGEKAILSICKEDERGDLQHTIEAAATRFCQGHNLNTQRALPMLVSAFAAKVCRTDDYLTLKAPVGGSVVKCSCISRAREFKRWSYKWTSRIEGSQEYLHVYKMHRWQIRDAIDKDRFGGGTKRVRPMPLLEAKKQERVLKGDTCGYPVLASVPVQHGVHQWTLRVEGDLTTVRVGVAHAATAADNKGRAGVTVLGDRFAMNDGCWGIELSTRRRYIPIYGGDGKRAALTRDEGPEFFTLKGPDYHTTGQLGCMVTVQLDCTSRLLSLVVNGIKLGNVNPEMKTPDNVPMHLAVSTGSRDSKISILTYTNTHQSTDWRRMT
jgi:hypothetical protein